MSQKRIFQYDNAVVARFGKGVSVERVDYEFQKGGNEMLRIIN